MTIVWLTRKIKIGLWITVDTSKVTCKYSGAPTYGHLVIMSTFFVLAKHPYISSYEIPFIGHTVKYQNVYSFMVLSRRYGHSSPMCIWREGKWQILNNKDIPMNVKPTLVICLKAYGLLVSLFHCPFTPAPPLPLPPPPSPNKLFSLKNH